MNDITKTKSWPAAMAARAAVKTAPAQDKLKKQRECSQLLRTCAAEAGLISTGENRRKI